MLAVRVAFGFCLFLAFEETASWTIDLPQVRKYFFEKSSQRDRVDRKQPRPTQVVYDNMHTKSLHFDYEKYKEHYADDYKYNGYMEQKVSCGLQIDEPKSELEKILLHPTPESRKRKFEEIDMPSTSGVLQSKPSKVHEAVQNGSAYLEGLRRSIEAYLQRLESCRQRNMTVNVVQLRPESFQGNSTFYDFLTNPANPITNPTNPNIVQSAILNLILPFSTYNLPVLTNLTSVTQLTTNFTNFMAMANNYTMFNMSDEFKDCMRADLASEHVRRLAELAVWAASELQDKLYADKYSEHDKHNLKNDHENGIGHGHGLNFEKYGHGHEDQDDYAREHDDHARDHDDTLVLRLAWFLDRLAHLTGFDPKQNFGEPSTVQPSTESPPMLPWMPTLISNADLKMLMTCLGGSNGTATERCALPDGPDAPFNLSSLQNMMRPAPPTPDLKQSASQTEEYTYSEQDFTDDDMPLSLPQRSKHKRSVQGDPLQNFVQYYAKYKTWTGANQEEKYSSEMSHVNTNKESAANLNVLRRKRFIPKKKAKHFSHLTSIVKHKLEFVKKDEKEAKGLKKFLDKLHKPKTEVKMFKFKKSKRSIKYSRKQLPRVPADPQMDISYYVKNKEGRSYTYNAAQALLVRAGLEQVFQNGNILVVQRYGSNYNPANREQILNGYVAGLADS